MAQSFLEVSATYQVEVAGVVLASSDSAKDAISDHAALVVELEIGSS